MAQKGSKMSWFQILALIASLLLGMVNGYNNWKQGQEIQSVEQAQAQKESVGPVAGAAAASVVPAQVVPAKPVETEAYQSATDGPLPQELEAPSAPPTDPGKR